MKRAPKFKQSAEITKSKVLLVEGQDEVNLLSELLKNLALIDDIQVINVGVRKSSKIAFEL